MEMNLYILTVTNMHCPWDKLGVVSGSYKSVDEAISYLITTYYLDEYDLNDEYDFDYRDYIDLDKLTLIQITKEGTITYDLDEYLEGNKEGIKAIHNQNLN